MLRFLYQATDHNQKRISAFVDAASIADARTKLEGAGMSSIEFLDDETGARYRYKRDPVPGLDPAIAAELEAKLRTKSGSSPALVGFIKANRSVLVVNLALLAYGLIFGKLLAVIVGLAATILLFGLFAYKRIPSVLYDRILRTMSVGDWDQALKLIARMERRTSVQRVLYDLAVRRACIDARRGKLQEGLASVRGWRAAMDDPKGTFDSRMASIHIAAGDEAGFVNQKRLAYEADPRNRSHVIDFALALARFGDDAQAEALLDAVDLADLPKMHSKFIHWARGLIHLKRGETADAVRELSSASQIAMASADQPAYWTAIGVINGTLSLALAKSGDKERARLLLQPVLTIFKVYADKKLSDSVEREVLGGPAAF